MSQSVKLNFNGGTRSHEFMIQWSDTWLQAKEYIIKYFEPIVPNRYFVG